MLDQDDLLAIFGAATATDLPMHRMELLAHLGSEKFHLRDAPNRASQLLIDLQYLQTAHDARPKLAGWLKVAVSLCTYRPAEKAVFEWGLRRLGVPAVSSLGAATSGAKTLLVLFANPLDGARLQVSEELREIDFGLQAHLGRMRREVLFEPRLVDLPGALTQLSPTHLHFAGHGSTNRGLHLAKTPGAPASIGGRELADLLRIACPGGLEVITLSACQTHGLAEDLLAVSQAVVCVEGDLSDGAAPVFGRAFYENLAHMSVSDAFELARTALRAHQRDEAADQVRLVLRSAR